MKKILFLLLCLPSLLLAYDYAGEFRVGYFRPSSHLLRDIYPRGTSCELQLRKNMCHNIGAWANINYYEKKGHSLGLGVRTRVQLTPFSLGLYYMVPFCEKVLPYVGLGASFTYVHMHNQTRFQRAIVRKYSFGGVAKSGLIYHITDFFFGTLFCDYYYSRISTHIGHQNTGGLRGGLGVGFDF